MDKRKSKSQKSFGETKGKKRKTNSAEEAHEPEQNKTEFHKKHKGKVSATKRKEQTDNFVRKAFSVQNLLNEKLKKVQAKRSGNEARTQIVEETKDNRDQVTAVNEKRPADSHNDSNEDEKSKSIKRKKSKEQTNTDNKTDSVKQEKDEPANKHEDEGEEEEDPEKAAIREKKREKRKQKKQQKEIVKQQNKDRAGTAQKASIDYLNQWKNNKDEWKFLKVRQVWLLQNMYDKALIDEDSFDVLLEYLEGLRGKSREMTVSAAEKVVETAESEENESSTAKFDRARQIIQLLSD